MNLPPKAARKEAELAVALIRRMEQEVRRGHPADQALRRYYREHAEFGARDRRFFSTLVFSWFRWRGWLAAPDPAHCAMAYLLDAAELHPAVALLSEQGGLSRFSPRPAGGMPVAEKAKQVGRWMATPAPAIEQLAPAWLPDQLHVPGDKEPDAHRRQCIEAFQSRPPTWLRVEHGAREQMSAALARLGIAADSHPRLAGALRLPGAPDLARLAADIDFEIQDLASQCVGWVCAPARGENWWDVCAGAGGKSLHLCDLMAGNGMILATDVRSASLAILRRRAGARKRRRIEPRVWDGIHDPAPARRFHGVLVDAPCSGLGTWARNPDARWRTAEHAIDRWRKIQQQLLAAGADKVSPGGRLVYAVCTLTDTETRAAIAAFLGARPDYQLEPTPHPLTGRMTGGQVWIWPWEADSNGMFIARMKRKDNSQGDT